MLDVGPGYVPAFITGEVLPSAPTAGQGVHRFLFNLARLLTPYRTADTIARILCDYASQCGRRVPNSEIKAAIRDGRRYAWLGNSERIPDCGDSHGVNNFGPNPQPPAPQFEPEAFRKFVAGHEGIDAEWLARRSPIWPSNRTPASFLHALYRKGEHIVIFDDFRSQGQTLWSHPGLPYDARTLNHFVTGRRYGVWFLTNPSDGQMRINDAGDESRRSWQNITSCRYLLIESDRNDITALDWLAAIVQVPLPIAAIYETGGRLPHALLRVDAETKEHWDHIRDSLAPLLIMIGADPRQSLRSQTQPPPLLRAPRQGRS